MTFTEDLQREMRTPAMNGTSVWLDGQPEEIQRAFIEWLQAGKSRAALFRVCQKHGLTHINHATTFREHCRDILESGMFDDQR